MSSATASPEPPSLLRRALSGVSNDEANADLLDAAYELFCQHGIQRTTMDDVAKRAGVSRITVYRRLDSKEALVEQVVLREFQRYLTQFLVDIAGAHTVEDRLVVGFVSSLRAIRSNPLIEGLMRTEPKTLIPSIMGEDGSTMTVVGDFLAGQLRREQQTGNIPDAVDVQVAAEIMVRVSASFLLTPSTRIDLDDDDQLERIARQYLAPMLRHR